MDVDDLLDEDEGERSTPEPRGNDAAAQARIDREKQKLRKEVDELRAWKVEREQADRARSVEATFAELGLNPKHAKFYQAEDASADAIKAWATAEDLLGIESEENPSPPPPAPTTGFTPTVIAGGTALGSKVYTMEEFSQLLETNPNQAMQIYNAGRVALDKAPGGSSFVGRDR